MFVRTVDALFPPGSGVSAYGKEMTVHTVLAGPLGGCNTPDPKVEYTEWEEGTWVCGDTEVTLTRAKTTTPFKWVNGAWVKDTANAVTTTETDTRQLTQQEIDENCSVEIPVTPPPTKATCDADGKLPSLSSSDVYTAAWDRVFNGPGVYTATYTVSENGTHFIGGETTITHQVTVDKRTGDCGLAETGIDAGPFLASGILLALGGGGLLAYRKVKSTPVGKHVA